MENKLIDKYPHIPLRKNWQITNDANYLLGQCVSLVEIIKDTPIIPDKYQEMKLVSFKKGAQATTAIEGNTLSDEEIQKIQEGGSVEPSKEYQEIEVKNILSAFNELLEKAINEELNIRITPDYLKHLHHLVGKDLGEHLEAIPGRFRNYNVHVNKYRCPDSQDVEYLIDKFCEWLYEEFRFDDEQKYKDAIIQAIVAHVNIELIHPFGDGNGRTGRLLEFFIFLRAGTPDTASHILSNHYNQTRTQYYRELKQISETRDLSKFIEYALLGLRDGLRKVLNDIIESQMLITWQKHIYDVFEKIPMKSKKTFKRRRNLILSLDINEWYDIDDLRIVNKRVARDYSQISDQTIARDLKILEDADLLISMGNKYKVNISHINSMMPKRNKSTKTKVAFKN